MRISKEIPKGNRLLIQYSVGKLKKMLKKETNKTKADRIRACIKRKKGMEIPAIAAELEVAYSTVHRWLLAVAREGPSALDLKKRPGARCRLDDDQCKKLYEIVEEGPAKHGYSGDAWTARRLIPVVKREFKADYGVRGMQLLLHRIGLSSRVPRPRHPKAATKKEIGRFKRMVAAMRGWRKDCSVCMIDSASLIAGWNMQRGWYPTGKTRFALVTLSRKRTHMLGALYDGELDIEFFHKVDSEAIEWFLRKQLARREWVMAILDNASAHHAGNIKSLEEEFGGRLVLVYLPPYTPELNSIEIQWRVIRKAIANIVFADVDALKEGVRKVLLSRDARIVPIASYARDKNRPPPRRFTVRVEKRVVHSPYYN